MPEHFDELVKSMESMKETQRIQFDYFKHLTTLSTGSILIIVAFLEKVFSYPEWIILAVFSIIALAVCLVASLFAMTPCSNVILDITGLRTIMTVGDKSTEERIKYKNKFSGKISKSLKRIGILDHISKYSFLLGIALFLIFAILNFL